MAKQVKERKFEYTLTITQHWNERRQIPTVLFTLETTKLFASFRYELSVRESLKDKTLRLTIVGLKAPQLDLPAAGSAQFIREYDTMKGKMEIVVANLDGTENTFMVSFSKSITLLKSPPNPFTNLVIV